MNKHTLRTHPSLFPLRMALFAAEMESPPQPPRPMRDMDELLAQRLIENIRYPKPSAFAILQIESPQPLFSESFLEMAGNHA